MNTDTHVTPQAQENVEIYFGIETLTGFAEPLPLDLPPSLAHTETAPAPRKNDDKFMNKKGLVLRGKDQGTSVDENELELLPHVRAALALQVCVCIYGHAYWSTCVCQGACVCVCV
jgi:hypothetical protein